MPEVSKKVNAQAERVLEAERRAFVALERIRGGEVTLEVIKAYEQAVEQSIALRSRRPRGDATEVLMPAGER